MTKDLESMDRAALLVAWQRVFATPVPRGLSQPLIRRLLAIELQTRASGGLSKAVLAALRKDPAVPARTARRGLKPGASLIREWNGVTHRVEVIDGGYLWRGDRHRSLSAIAREITGAHWSGPRFFGLTKGSPS